jgi:hypothetical protein
MREGVPLGCEPRQNLSYNIPLDTLRKIELPSRQRRRSGLGRLIKKRKFPTQVAGGAEDRGDHRVIETPVPRQGRST